MVALKNLMIGVARNASAPINKSCLQCDRHRMHNHICIEIFKNGVDAIELPHIGSKEKRSDFTSQQSLQIFDQQAEVFIKTRLRICVEINDIWLDALLGC